MGIDGRTRREFLRGSLRLTGNLVAPSLVVGSTSWLSPRFRAMAAAAPSRAASDEALLAEAVHKGTVKIIGARYDLETGVVEVIV